MRGKAECVVKEHVQKTHAQSQRGLGSRVGGGDGWSGEEQWGEMETTVLEHRKKGKKYTNGK